MLYPDRFSALQRVEIAEICTNHRPSSPSKRVSVLFNESKLLKSIQSALPENDAAGFSTLQRVEIAEILRDRRVGYSHHVSVLFNESKLLKSTLSQHLLFF